MITRAARAALSSALAVLALSWPGNLALAAGPSGPSGHRTTVDAAVSRWNRSGGAHRERLIVRVMPGRRATVRNELRGLGLTVKAEHPFIDALTIEVPRSAVYGLSHNPHVLSISLDAVTRAHAEVAPVGQTLIATLGLSYSGAPRGAGVGIAVVDSGIVPSNVFGSRLGAFYDFTGGVARAVAPLDPYGHGTHVAGLAAGSGVPSDGLYQGVATSARLVGLRVLDGNGQGYTSDVIAALEFATVNRAQLGIDVINLSLGHPILEPAASDPLVQAVEAAVRSGLVVVVSAGNIGRNIQTGEVGYGGITSPGNAPSAITVGAVDTAGTKQRADDAVTPYSSRGPTWYDAQTKPDVVAPGHLLTAVSSVTCKLYQDYPNARASASGDSNQYLRLNGTSMAAAVVSGVVAAMIDAHRSAISWNTRPLPPNAIKAMLEYSAVSLRDTVTGLPLDELTQGAGAVNAHGAVRLAQSVDAARGTGSSWAIELPSPSSNLQGQPPLAWSQHIVWGSHLVWGSSLYFHETAWDATTTWGVLEPAHIVWGTIDPLHLVWGNTAVWADHIVWGNALVGSVDGQHIVWGNLVDAEHIVWGNLVDAEHIVWGNLAAEHLVWGNSIEGTNDPDVMEAAPDPNDADVDADGL